MMQSLLKRKSVQYGIPFLLFMVGAPFGLKEFQALRYKPLVEQDIQAEAAKYGIKLKDPKETSIEAEYEKIKDKTFDNWENKRIPRPWE